MSMENQYASIDLFMPATIHEMASTTLVKQAGAGQRAAFDRQIDLWWFGFVLGLRTSERLRLADLPHKPVKFNVGQILQGEPWRITLIELAAIGKEGFEIIGSPKSVMDFAAEHAYAGLARIEAATRGEEEPLLRLFTDLYDLVALEGESGL